MFVVKTASFKELQELAKHDKPIWLRDYDGYNTQQTLKEIANNPKRKMGHAFVLKALLTNDPVLKEFDV